MKVLASFGLAFVAYCIVSIALCGDPIAPLAQITMFSDHLGISHWRLGVVGSAFIAWLIVSRLASKIAPISRFPLFVVAWMLISVISIGSYADWIRRERIAEFEPDLEIQYSFFRSIREAPREPQFFTHAVVLKDCVPYLWSYRMMRLTALVPNVAVNVLPNKWIRQCRITRTN